MSLEVKNCWICENLHVTDFIPGKNLPVCEEHWRMINMNESTKRVGEMIEKNENSSGDYSPCTYEQFDQYFDEFIKECQGMRDTKGREYAGAKDRFDNFNRQSKKNGVDRLVVANIYLGKHLDAIDNYVREGKVYSSEGIRGRIIDAVTYLILIAGMIELNQK